MLHWPGFSTAYERAQITRRGKERAPRLGSRMSPAPLHAPPPETVERDSPLHAEQLRLLFRFSLVGYLATLLVVFILGGILWEDLVRPQLFAWFVAVSMVAIGRYLIYKSYIQRSPPPEETQTWEGRFIAGTVLAGLCWMALGTALLPDSTRMVQRLSVVMLIMLLMTGAVAYYAPHRFAYKITAFLGLVPLALTLGASGDRSQQFLSGVILILAGMLPYVHALVHRSLVESLTTRRMKENLQSELEEERIQLQKANEALADEMVGRLKAQQNEVAAAQKLRMHIDRTPLAVRS